jgi:hypothetical protein
MEHNATRDGLSARQRTIGNFRFLFMLMLLLPLSACHEKTNGQEQANTKPMVTADSTYKPDVKIQVNKRYDDNGNLVGFDSLYSTFYSTASGDTLDRMRHGFEAYFNRQHSTFFNNRMNALFLSDTLSYPDFFHDDFFRQHLQLNDAYMKDMMQRMDSIKNEYYTEQSRRNRKKLPKDKT